jgi:hypothetical protein
MKMANLVSRHGLVFIPLDTVKAGFIAEKQVRNKSHHGLARAIPLVGAWVHSYQSQITSISMFLNAKARRMFSMIVFLSSSLMGSASGSAHFCIDDL